MSAGDSPTPVNGPEETPQPHADASWLYGTSTHRNPLPEDLSTAEALAVMRTRTGLRRGYREVMDKAEAMQREVEASKTSPAPRPGFRREGHQWTDPERFAVERRKHLEHVEAQATAVKARMSYRDYLRARAAQQYVDVRDRKGSGTHRALVLRVTPTGLIVRRGDGEVLRVALPSKPKRD